MKILYKSGLEELDLLDALLFFLFGVVFLWVIFFFDFSEIYFGLLKPIGIHSHLDFEHSIYILIIIGMSLYFSFLRVQPVMRVSSEKIRIFKLFYYDFPIETKSIKEIRVRKGSEGHIIFLDIKLKNGVAISYVIKGYNGDMESIFSFIDRNVPYNLIKGDRTVIF